MSSISIRRINGEIKKIQKELPLMTKSFYVDESDLYNMYFLIEPKDDLFCGEYILHIKLPSDFPLKPPQIRCLTPNGRFDVGIWLCMNISHYHSETWNASMSISNIVNMSTQYLLEKKMTGIGIINSSDDQKIALGKKSIEENIKIMSDNNIIF